MDRPCVEFKNCENLFRFADFVLAQIFLDTTGGIDKLLLAGIERMTLRTDFHFERIVWNGQACLKRVPASALNFNKMITGVNIRLHVKLQKISNLNIRLF